MSQMLSVLQIIIVTIILRSLLTSRSHHVEASEYRITRVQRVQAVAPNNHHYLRAFGQHYKQQHVEKNEYIRAEPVATPLHINLHNESYHHHQQQQQQQQRFPNTHGNNNQQQHSNHKHDSNEHHQHDTNGSPGQKNTKDDIRIENVIETTANEALAKEGPASNTANHNGSDKNDTTKEARN